MSKFDCTQGNEIRIKPETESQKTKEEATSQDAEDDTSVYEIIAKGMACAFGLTCLVALMLGNDTIMLYAIFSIFLLIPVLMLLMVFLKLRYDE